MGKSSYPSYSGGAVSINGQQKASSYQNGNTVYTNYNMSDAEKYAYDYAQNSFAASLPKLNVFDANTQQGFNDQLSAYTKQGMKIINDTYTPLIRNLENDIAKRFGNFDNSAFMDELGELEDKRSEAVSALASDVMEKRSDIINNELSQRYNYLNFLGNVQSSIYNNALNYINAAASNSAAGNNYNAQAFAAGQNINNTLSNYANMASTALSFMGPYGKAAAVAIQAGKQFI